MSQKHHICVCICTYKRPALLRHLLSKLEEQETENLFDYSIVIVDNDRSESARQTVESFALQSKLSINYFVEPDQNIALARNKAVENAKGDLIAFIDDDEFPKSDWILNLYAALRRFKADGVLGPVVPHLDKDCPKWLIKAKILERTSHTTGAIMRGIDTRTGNLLLKKEIFNESGNHFDHQFGRTGGEDVWFFIKVIKKGWSFIWCEEALVYESIPFERRRWTYYLKRSVRIGGLTGDEVRNKGLPGSSILRVIVASCIYLMILPPSLLIGKHLFMRYLVKIGYNIAYILGYCGHVPIRFRDD